MGLKVELKPGERLILGECLITNGDQRTRFVVEGSAPVLREKDIMTREAADTPAKRIYFAVQLMYTSRDPQAHHEAYFSLIRDLVQAVPSAWPQIEIINNQILTGNLYKALKHVQTLISYEKDILLDATRGQCLRKDRQANREPSPARS